MRGSDCDCWLFSFMQFSFGYANVEFQSIVTASGGWRELTTDDQYVVALIFRNSVFR